MTDTRYLIRCKDGCYANCYECQRNKPDRNRRVLLSAVYIHLEHALRDAQIFRSLHTMHFHDYVVEICTTSGELPV